MEPKNPYQPTQPQQPPEAQPAEEKPSAASSHGPQIPNPYAQPAPHAAPAQPSAPQNPYQPTRPQQPPEAQPAEEKPSAASSHEPQVANPYAQSLPQVTPTQPSVPQDTSMERATGANNMLFAPPVTNELAPVDNQFAIQSTQKKPAALTLVMILDTISGFSSALLGIGLLLGGITFILGVYSCFVAIIAIRHVIRLSANPPNVITPNRSLAVLQIISIITGNLLSFAIGVTNLIIYSLPAVKAFYAHLSNAQLLEEDVHK